MTPAEINDAVALKLGVDGSSYPWVQTGPSKPWHITGGAQWCGEEEPPKYFPDYCHDIKAAWDILQTLDKIFILEQQAKGQWRVDLGRGPSYSDTAPMAICLAFLKLP